MIRRKTFDGAKIFKKWQVIVDLSKIKEKFSRLPIIITADGLYVTKKVLQICKDYNWDYIIRYKEGSASSIAKEYRALPEKEKVV